MVSYTVRLSDCCTCSRICGVFAVSTIFASTAGVSERSEPHVPDRRTCVPQPFEAPRASRTATSRRAQRPSHQHGLRWRLSSCREGAPPSLLSTRLLRCGARAKREAGAGEAGGDGCPPACPPAGDVKPAWLQWGGVGSSRKAQQGRRPGRVPPGSAQACARASWPPPRPTAAQSVGRRTHAGYRMRAWPV